MPQLAAATQIRAWPHRGWFHTGTANERSVTVVQHQAISTSVSVVTVVGGGG